MLKERTHSAQDVVIETIYSPLDSLSMPLKYWLSFEKEGMHV